MNDFELATLAFALILVASMFSVEVAISSAIIEIVFGVLAGNIAHVNSTPWIDFLASFAGVLLTFLAGAEVDPRVLKEKPKEAIAIGGLSFCRSLPRAYSHISSPVGASDSRRSPGSHFQRRPSRSSMPCSLRLALRRRRLASSSWPQPSSLTWVP